MNMLLQSLRKMKIEKADYSVIQFSYDDPAPDLKYSGIFRMNQWLMGFQQLLYFLKILHTAKLPFMKYKLYTLT